MDKDQRYNKRYYEANRERINARRREKYAKDKAYREKAKKQAQDYKERERTSPKERGRKPGMLPSKNIEVSPGKIVKGYTIGTVAKMLGVSIQTIRAWVRKEVIPDTPFSVSRYKYWTKDMVEVLENAMAKSPESGRGLVFSEFSKLVNENWPEYARKGDSNG